MTAPAAPGRVIPSRWIVNPWVDILCVASLSGVFLLMLLGLGGLQQKPGWVVSLAFTLQVVCNWPHFAASYVRLYSSWANIKEYALVSMWMPLLLLAATVGTLFYPAAIGPWFAKSFLLWAGHHYSGQTYGIALIYCRKVGYQITDREKWMLRAPIWLSYIFPILLAEMAHGPQQFYGITMPTLHTAMQQYLGFGIPSLVGDLVQIAFWLSLLVLMVRLLVRRFKGEPMPWIALLVIGAQILWYIRLSGVESFYEFVPFLHCLQYMVIVTAFHRSSWLKEGQNTYVAFFRYFGVLVLLGGFLFEVIPVLLTHTGITAGVAYAAILTFINLHHYMIDGVIWKLRKPEIRKALVGADPA